MRENPFTTRFGMTLIAIVIVSAIAGLAFTAYMKRSVESETRPGTQQVASTEVQTDGQGETSEDSDAVEYAESEPTENETAAANVPSLPSFTQFAVQVSDQKVPLQLDPSSPNWDFRTRIRTAYEDVRNFGANGVVTTWGCGTSCSMGVVIDRASGTVADFPLGGEDNPYLSVYSKSGSSLILATWEQHDGESGASKCVFEALNVTGDEFISVDGFPTTVAGTCPYEL